MPIIKSIPEILHAIVGTAGHVDHGKTSLVKLLTGCGADRLPEEKARGMSIDLGFAPCVLHGRRMVGIVDVPGHKDFIRNMVAGATSIDVLMLVVAADDGVMPQTQEHMKLIRLLRAPQVMVALTKIDMVSPEMLEMAKQDVAAFMGKAGFADAPIIPVSNMTGEGIGEVRDTIDRLVEQVRQRPADQRAFRMNVERVFAVKGYGTVVTGIPVSGKINVGDKLQLLPAGKDIVVRTIQCYKHDSPTAFANCCCAINVRDVEAEEVKRGMTIATPGVYHATDGMIATLQNATEDQTFKRRFPAMFHTGTVAVEGTIKLLDVDALPPGQEAIGHIALAEPIALAAGDRFIVRAISPAATLGGGVVLSSQPPRMHRPTMELLDLLQKAQQAAREGDFLQSELLAGPNAIVSQSVLEQCRARCGSDGSQSEPYLSDLGGGAFAVTERIGEVIDRLVGALGQYHREHPYTWGMTPAHACEFLGVDVKNFAKLAKLLCGTGKLAIKNGRVALASFKPAISDRLMNLREQILKQIHGSGINAPARGNLMKELTINDKDMDVLTKLLVEDGTVLHLDGNFMLRSIYEECRGKMLLMFEKQNCVELNAFRDMIGANRKMAVAMLDAFDAEGMTRRVPEGRVLVKRLGITKGEV